MSDAAPLSDSELFEQLNRRRANGEGSSPDVDGLFRCLDLLDGFAAHVGATCEPTLPLESAGRGTSGMTLEGSFGDYDLEGIIGRGAMGVVYRGRHRSLGSPAALKVIRDSQLAGRAEIDRFYREAKAAASVRHPHIVSVHHVGERGGQPYLVMDYIDGRPLSRWKRTLSSLPPSERFEQIACLVCKIARAVDHLHNAGIVHRDLKPSNILVDAAGEPYVTDFGLAKQAGAEGAATTTGAILGTPAFMPPEQARGEAKRVGPAADVYAIGAVLYDLLTGRPPFVGENPLDLILAVIESEPPRPRTIDRTIPHDLQRICLRCLEKDSERRYASAADIAAELDRFLRGEAILTGGDSWTHRLSRWFRREPAFAVHVAALLAMSLLVDTQRWFAGYEPDRHAAVMQLLLGWLALAAGIGWWSRPPQREPIGKWTWAAVDLVMLTAILATAGDSTGPPLIAFPILITASALWLDPWLVRFVSIGSSVSFLFLRLAYPPVDEPPHYTLIFLVGLILIGSVVNYHLGRLRHFLRPGRGGGENLSAVPGP